MVIKNTLGFCFLLSLVIACTSESKKSEISDKPIETIDPLKEDDPRNVILSSTKIDLETFDQELLEKLVLDEINKQRADKGIQRLENNTSLHLAAKNQNDYQIKIDQLTHEQENAKMSNLIDRVQHYNGQFFEVAENVQYIGLTVIHFGDRQDLVTPTYAKAAELLIQGWVNSSGHYLNLINPKYDYAGTAVGYSEKRRAFFATQVYGGS